MERKRRSISIKDKIFILNEITINKHSRLQIMNKYGLAKSSLSRILSNEDKIRNFAKAGGLRSLKMKRGKYEELDNQLFRYFIECKQNNYLVNGTSLREKASSIGTDLGLRDFKNSSGWFDNWKRRHGIKSLGKRKQEGDSFFLEETPLDQDTIDLYQDSLYIPEGLVNIEQPSFINKTEQKPRKKGPKQKSTKMKVTKKEVMDALDVFKKMKRAWPGATTEFKRLVDELEKHLKILYDIKPVETSILHYLD